MAHETSSSLAIYEIDNSLGMKEQNTVLEIYPNPTSSFVVIRSDKPYNYYILYSLTGQILQHGAIDNEKKIDLFGLNSIILFTKFKKYNAAIDLSLY